MLPLIIGVVTVGAGVAYLLDDAKSSNSRAIDEYNDTLDSAKKETKRAYYNAQKRDMLDKLFKVKRAKQKISNSIYKEIKNSKKNLKKVNKELKRLKDELSKLFDKKQSTTDKGEKKAIQKNINIIVATRKEIFGIRDGLKSDIDELYDRLDSINFEIRNIQDEIDRIREES